MKIAPISVDLIGSFGSDLHVVNAARVSFEKESQYVSLQAIQPDGSVHEFGVLNEADRRLLSYLAKHKHFSPFNHCFLSFRVKAPIFVARQLVKHKFMPWNEVSRRYVDSDPEFFVPDAYRLKAENVKQGSSDDLTDKFINPWNFEECKINDVHSQHIDASMDMYRGLLSSGICPEQARMVLPQNMMTEWLWSGTLGAFADMLKLRLDPHSQKESRDVANMIYELACPLFPVSLPSLLDSK